jgi:hypothetical protein
MKYKFAGFYICLIGLFSGAESHAQASSSSVPIVRALHVEASHQTVQPYYLRTSEGVKPLVSGFRRRGAELQPLLVSGRLDLLREQPSADGPAYVTVFSFPLQNSASSLLLVFPVEGGSPVLLDDSLDAHPVGSVRMVNLSTQPLTGMVEQSRFDIDPKASFVVPVQTEEIFPIKLAVSYEGQWRPIKSVTARIRSGARILCLGRFVQAEQESYFDLTPIMDRPVSQL